jgi:hypothetical protein
MQEPMRQIAARVEMPQGHWPFWQKGNFARPCATQGGLRLARRRPDAVQARGGENHGCTGCISVGLVRPDSAAASFGVLTPSRLAV